MKKVNEVKNILKIDDVDIRKFEINEYMSSVPPEDRVKIQRPIHVEKWLWDAAGTLKLSRPQIIRNALLAAVMEYHTEIPQVENDIEEIDKDIEALLIQKNAKIHYLNELKAKQTEFDEEQKLALINREQAVLETMQFLDRFFRDMGAHHFKRLEELSGVPARDIKAFVSEKNFTPSEEEMRNFFNL